MTVEMSVRIILALKLRPLLFFKNKKIRLIAIMAKQVNLLIWNKVKILTAHIYVCVCVSPSAGIGRQDKLKIY